VTAAARRCTSPSQPYRCAAPVRGAAGFDAVRDGRQAPADHGAGQGAGSTGRRALARLDDLEQTARSLRGIGQDDTVGVVSTAKYFAPRLLASCQMHSGLEFKLTIHNRAEIIEQLQSYAIDLGIMGQPRRGCISKERRLLLSAWSRLRLRRIRSRYAAACIRRPGWSRVHRARTGLGNRSRWTATLPNTT